MTDTVSIALKKGSHTYSDDIIGICAVKIGDSYTWWEGFLSLECLVEALTKVWLNTKRLRYEYTHSHETLLSRIIALIDSVVQHQDHKVMGSVSIDNDRAKALVALQSFPE